MEGIVKSIIFLGTNKSGSSREAIRVAKKLGYETILFTNKRRFFEQRWEYPDIDLMVYVSSMFDENIIHQEITSLKYGERMIKAIISFIEPYVYYAATLSVEHCKSSLSLDAIEIMEDKTRTREMLKNHPVTPYFRIINDEKELEGISTHQLPLIVKSPLSTGSKDVLLASTVDDLYHKVHQLMAKYPSEEIILEEYLKGPQYLVEVIVQDSQIFIAAVIEQTISELDRFIVTGYSYDPVDNELYNNLKIVVYSVIEDIQLQNGSCHLEMRLVNKEWKLIEINPRISGGAMNRMVEIGSGINIAEETLRLYVGEPVSMKKQYEKCVFTKYITVGSKGILIKATGRLRAEAIPGVQEVFIKPKKGMVLKPPESMGDRYGYVIASDISIEKAKETALRAAKEIAFYLEPL